MEHVENLQVQSSYRANLATADYLSSCPPRHPSPTLTPSVSSWRYSTCAAGNQQPSFQYVDIQSEIAVEDCGRWPRGIGLTRFGSIQPFGPFFEVRTRVAIDRCSDRVLRA